LDREHDNLRAALDWLTAHGAPEPALRLAVAASAFWEARGHFTEGRARLAALLAQAGLGAPHTVAYAETLRRAGHLAWAQGDYRGQQRHDEAALAVYRELGDAPGIALALSDLAAAAFPQGRHGAARTLLAESLALYRELGDERGISLALMRLASVTRDQGDYPPAGRMYAEALALRRAAGDRLGVAHVLSNMGWLALYQGHLDAARDWQEESLAIRAELGDQREVAVSWAALGKVALAGGDRATARACLARSLPVHQDLGNQWGIALALEGLAGVAAAEAPRRALRLAGAAAALRHAISRPLPPAERPLLDRWLAPARQALDAGAQATAWAEGRAMPLEQAIAYALEDAPEATEQTPTPVTSVRSA
jgi:tetratricopeptide (TPR) repeat protein